MAMTTMSKPLLGIIRERERRVKVIVLVGWDACEQPENTMATY